MTKRYIFDLETNGFLGNMTRIHCLCIRDVDTGENFSFNRFDGGVTVDEFGEEKTVLKAEFEPMDDIEDGVRMLMEADVLIGHNIARFDIKAIQKLYPWFQPTARIDDTLVMARMLLADTKPIDFRMIERGTFPAKLLGSHSLDAWGWRLGLHKGDYSKQMEARGLDPWAKWNLPMLLYCSQDVEVTAMLYSKIMEAPPPDDAIRMEHEIHDLTGAMTDNGVFFDKAEAEKLTALLRARHESLSEVAVARYGIWYRPAKKYHCAPTYKDQVGKPKKLQYQKPRPEFGEDDSRPVWAEVTVPKTTTWLDPSLPPDVLKKKIKAKAAKDKALAESGETKVMRGLIGVDKTEGAPYCVIEAVEFNPNSRHHIADRFSFLYDWEPLEFTETGQPVIDDTILRDLSSRIPEAEDLAEIFFYKKTLGQIADGKESWLNNYNEETGCIHGGINVGGTVSSRCSHQRPNTGQVPAVLVEDVMGKDGKPNPKVLDTAGAFFPECYDQAGALKKKVALLGRQGEFGYECRSLFYTPAIIDNEEWVQVGVDLSGIEARCLASETFPFDGGELINVILSGDLHQFNMQKTGITNRNLIKRVFYAVLYGAGDEKLGITADPFLKGNAAKREGAKLRKIIMDGLPALKKATEKWSGMSRDRGYILAIDGSRLPSRSPHSALNLRLQSSGAKIAKKWTLLTEQKALEQGWNHGWRGDFAMMLFIHDENQCAVKKRLAERYAELCCEAAKEAGEYFNFPIVIEAEAKIGHNWADTH